MKEIRITNSTVTDILASDYVPNESSHSTDLTNNISKRQKETIEQPSAETVGLIPKLEKVQINENQLERTHILAILKSSQHKDNLIELNISFKKIQIDQDFLDSLVTELKDFKNLNLSQNDEYYRLSKIDIERTLKEKLNLDTTL